jgi:Na+-translocating ferredoxin:NAD+ oxidoreductase RnfE subunit
MPQLPIIIPIIVTGLIVGSAIKSSGFSKKRLGLVSVLSGLLNGAEAYLVNYLMPQPTVRTGTFPGGGSFTGAGTFTGAAALRQTSVLTFTVSSVLVGILIPLFIVGIGMIYARSRKSEEGVELEDSLSEK